MKNIVIFISENQIRKKVFKTLTDSLKEEGYALFVFGSPDATNGRLLSHISCTLSPFDSILVTDRERIMKHAICLGFAVLALDCGEYPTDDLWSAADAVLDLSDIDSEYLERCYRRFHGLPLTVAETDRLILREIAEEDLLALHTLMNESSTRRWVDPSWTDLEEGMVFEKAYRKEMYGFYEFGLWGVFLKETGEMIGRVGLEIQAGFDEPELGYLIGEKYREQGYCLEACNAALSYAKNELFFPCVHCFIEEGNLPSKAVAQRLGFVSADDPASVCRGNRLLTHFVMPLSQYFGSADSSKAERSTE